MILGQTIPYMRQRATFTTADEWGSWVAHMDLVHASLEYGVVDAVHYFTFVSPQYADPDKGRQELSREYPGRVLLRDQHQIASLTPEFGGVFLCGFGPDHNALVLRQMSGADAFPISAILHSVPSRPPLSPYLTALVFCKPHDSIVVTSRAGRRALAALMDGIADFASSRWKTRVTNEMMIADIPLAVESRLFAGHARMECRDALGLPRDATILLYLGRLTEHFKADLEPLLNIFATLRSNYPDLHLVLAGKDDDAAYGRTLEQRAIEAGVGGHIGLLSNFPFCVKPMLYSAADIFISPVDNIQETFGLSVLEAMASGLPVVASDWSGYRDLVVHGETGFLVPTMWNPAAVDDSFRQTATAGLPDFFVEYNIAQNTVIDPARLRFYIQELIDNPDLRRRFGDAGRTRVETEFSWKTVAVRFGELWQEQLRLLTRQNERPRARLLPGHNAAFRRFAAATLDPGMLFGCSPRGQEMLLGGQQNGALRPGPGISTAEALRILDACQQEPRTVQDLIGSESPQISGAIAWLWKKGYIEQHAANSRRTEACA